MYRGYLKVMGLSFIVRTRILRRRYLGFQGRWRLKVIFCFLYKRVTFLRRPGDTKVLFFAISRSLLISDLTISVACSTGVTVTRWTKQAFPCSKLLSLGVSFGQIQHLRGLNSIALGYLNFTAGLT